MSVLFDRIPMQDLGTTWKWRGIWLGLVPVYIDDPDALAPTIVERNGVPRLWFDVVTYAFEALARLFGLMLSIELQYSFLVTGRIVPDGHAQSDR